MSAGWVAGTVRARAIARRRLGSARTREVATSASFSDAIDQLVHSPYGQRVRPGDSLPIAARGVALTLLWNLRVLAGWLPSAGADLLRVLAGWFEIANVEEHLRALRGLPAESPFPLGALATAWPRLAASSSPDALRVILASSPWGDPGGTGARDAQLVMRLAWADRVAVRVPAAREWALGAAALLVARERFARRLPLPARAGVVAIRVLGPGVVSAPSIGDLGPVLPASARWSLHGVSEATHLWEAELGWWHRVRADSTRLLAGSGFGPERIVGAAGLLAADAWSVTAALEIAARGRDAWELCDALA